MKVSAAMAIRCARRLARFAAVVVLAAALGGCLSLAVSEEVATREEPRYDKTFLLTADEKAYVVSRWWKVAPGRSYCEEVTIKRSDLPAGCAEARFFLGDTSREMPLAVPLRAPWKEGVSPPLPDDGSPPCALLVSYGLFTGPPELDGVAVTAVGGQVAKGERLRPNPAVWALTPAAMFAEGYAIVGAVIASPVLLPAIYLIDKDEEERKAREKGALPPAVGACWTAVDDRVKTGWWYGGEIKVSGFEWSSARAGTYALAPVDALCEEAPAADTRVALRGGQVDLSCVETAMDVECDLLAGEIVEVRLTPAR